MPLTPKAIFEDLRSKDLDKASAIQLLLTLIENTENVKSRIESIEILEKISPNDNKTFKFLEHLLISDTDENVRKLTSRVIKKLFLDKALSPLSWALEHEHSLSCLITIISTIAEIDMDKTRSLLINKINKFSKNKNKFNLNGLFNNNNIHNLSNKELADILINYYILSSLRFEFGYIKFEISDNNLITGLDLSNVERYVTGSSKLEKILELIFSIKTLKKCDLRFNHLTKLPIVFNKSIEYLDLSYNKLVKLPNFSKFKALKILNLKSNRLRNLPESIGSVNSLESLNLRNNILVKLPSSIGSLDSLESLDLHGNKFNSIDIILNNALRELELGWNNFEKIPESIKFLSLLEKFGIGGNKIFELPEWIGNFQTLRELDLYDNNLHQIPNSIGSLVSLEKLNLRNNHLNELPYSMSKLESLKSLNLSWNSFTDLPDWIGNLSSLEELNLWGNKLKSLPNSIVSLSSLKILDLNFNKFEKIPTLFKELERKNGLIIKF